MPKTVITFIGAGSTVFTKNIAGDILSRPALADAEVRLMDINPERLAESEVIVNLAGEPIFGKRWTDQIKSEIYDSRVDGTKKIVESMRRANEKFPGKSQALINASAVGFYGSRGDESLDEESDHDAGYAPHHHVYLRADWQGWPKWRRWSRVLRRSRCG